MYMQHTQQVHLTYMVCTHVPSCGEAVAVVVLLCSGWACVGRPDFKSKSGMIGWVPSSFLQPVSAMDESCIDHSVDYAQFKHTVSSAVKEKPGLCVCVCVHVCVCHAPFHHPGSL